VRVCFCRTAIQNTIYGEQFLPLYVRGHVTDDKEIGDSPAIKAPKKKADFVEPKWILPPSV
jgi:hypothetical protein